MRSHRATSQHVDAKLAVAELTAGWEGAAPEVAFVFCSSKQNADDVAAALAERWPTAVTVGCSTTGEQLDGDPLSGSVTLCALADSGVKWTAACIEDLGTFDEGRARAAASSFAEAAGIEADGFDPRHHFAIVLIDGLSMREEAVSATLADALEGISVVGGSAGDDLAFSKTKVFLNGKAASNAAVVVFGATERRFSVIKHQHFTATPRHLVVTSVDPARRRVYELDGLPAAVAYARALGLPRSELTDEVTFMNPIVFEVQGQIYVRSVQRIEPDDSMVFYCAVEEGMVLSIGDHKPMATSLEADLADLVRAPADFMITFNCILRALEAKKTDCRDQLGMTLKRASRCSIGFDTYGEQLGGLHINQTLVALAIHS